MPIFNIEILIESGIFVVMKIDGSSLFFSRDTYGIGKSSKKKEDKKEAQVARKLGMSVKEFSSLSETEKMMKVREYNNKHPNDKIEDKGMPPIQPQGAEMENFHNSVNWDNVKLE